MDIVKIVLDVGSSSKGPAEVRKISVDRGNFNLNLFSRWLKVLFPTLESSHCRVTWMDREGDEVTMESELEFQIAIREMLSDRVQIKFTIKKKVDVLNDQECDTKKGSVQPCQGCQEAPRFKCTECPAFYLCKECCLADKHNHHKMVRAVPEILRDLETSLTDTGSCRDKRLKDNQSVNQLSGNRLATVVPQSKSGCQNQIPETEQIDESLSLLGESFLEKMEKKQASHKSLKSEALGGSPFGFVMLELDDEAQEGRGSENQMSRNVVHNENEADALSECEDPNLKLVHTRVGSYYYIADSENSIKTPSKSFPSVTSGLSYEILRDIED